MSQQDSLCPKCGLLSWSGHRCAAVLIMSENKNAKTPADGPVAWSCQCGRPYTVTCISSKPPKREWVGLTDAERQEIFDACETTDRGYVLAMCEAKLREKNHG